MVRGTCLTDVYTHAHTHAYLHVYTLELLVAVYFMQVPLPSHVHRRHSSAIADGMLSACMLMCRYSF